MRYKENLRFILTLIKMKLYGQMMYRLSFLGATFVDGTLFLLWLIMFNAIYGQVDTIGGWDIGQMTVFVGTFSLINAINMTIYFFGVNGIPGKIKSGELDHYLTKPINPLLRLTFESINIGSTPLILLSVAIVMYGVSLTNVSINIWIVLLYTMFIILMTLLYYNMEIIIRTLPFFFISSGGIERLENAALDLCMGVPGVLFHGVFKFLFYLVLPYGIMATIPTQILTNDISWQMVVLSVVIVIAFTIFAQWFWRFGLKHYNSASS